MNASFSRLNASFSRIKAPTRQSFQQQQQQQKLGSVPEHDFMAKQNSDRFDPLHDNNASRMSFVEEHSNYSDDEADDHPQYNNPDNLHSNNYNNNNDNNDSNNKDALARGETTAMKYFRFFILVFLFTLTVGMSVLAFQIPKRHQEEQFQQRLADYQQEIRQTVSHRMDTSIHLLQNFVNFVSLDNLDSTTTSSTTSSTQFNNEALQLIRLTQLFLKMTVVPIIPNNQIARTEWETYSVNKYLNWIDASSISPIIFQLDTLNTIPASLTTDPFVLPHWQFAPLVDAATLVNFNLLSEATYRDGYLEFLNQTTKTVIAKSTTARSQVLELFVQPYSELTGIVYSTDEPVADIHVPLNNGSSTLTSTIYWKSLLTTLVIDDPLDVVLQNTCNQQYTYQLQSEHILYKGTGDSHDRSFDNYVDTTIDRINLASNNNNNCQYSMLVYPTRPFQDSYKSTSPWFTTIAIATSFLLVAVLFRMYDIIIERRQSIVMDEATASTAIVSSLFPKTVRDRLVHNPGDLAGLDLNTVSSSKNKKESDEGAKDSPPIADTFENTTVLFADIAGFTSWCAQHEPSDVFLLLETLYGEFDKIARKRDVFKVETIGDCYVAVTGLPEPQEDHAIIMSLFSHECMRTMKMLMSKELRSLLGGDSSRLSMRFGLHSGKVTAGVLRGEKSRFQLFGDTVNMAARIEHTGKRDRIHISETTGALLIEAGKKKWLVERTDVPTNVGNLTYWLRPRAKTLSGKHHRNRSSTGSVGSAMSVSTTPDEGTSTHSEGLDNMSSHSQAWPEASTHGNGWSETDSADGFTMDEEASDSAESFA